MSDTSTRVFVYEAMGRHAGWPAAAAGLAAKTVDEAPQIPLFPERPYDEPASLARVARVVARLGWCVVPPRHGLRPAAALLAADAGACSDPVRHPPSAGA